MAGKTKVEPRPGGAYSTGEIADACKVANRTVVKWIDGGLLKAFTVPGTGGHRRVLHADLAAFMRAHGMHALLVSIGEHQQS